MNIWNVKCIWYDMMTDILHITEPASRGFGLRWLQIVAKEGTVTAMHLCIILCVLTCPVCLCTCTFSTGSADHEAVWSSSRLVVTGNNHVCTTCWAGVCLLLCTPVLCSCITSKYVCTCTSFWQLVFTNIDITCSPNSSPVMVRDGSQSVRTFNWFVPLCAVSGETNKQPFWDVEAGWISRLSGSSRSRY